jgi:hypothetical protein
VDPRTVPPHPEGSPYAGWALPDIKHCEDNLAGWIAAPANTWSNLVYVAAALFIWRNAAPGGPLSARGLGAVSIAVGVTSFVFHASYTWAGQLLDYAGMFLLTGWTLARALMRMGLLDERGAARFWAGAFAASVGAWLLFSKLGWGVQLVMLAQAVAIIALELRLMARRDAPTYAPLFAMIALLAAGYACWHLDHTDAFCRPADHLFQLHAAWHGLTALAFLAAWRFHEGVDALRAKR